MSALDKLIEIRREAHALMSEHGLIADGWKFEINGRKGSCGLTNYTQKTISYSKYFIGRDSDYVRNTILHEIAHALVGPGKGHNWEWKHTFREIGGQFISRTAPDSPEFEGKWNYEIICPECGANTTRHRLKVDPKRFTCRPCRLRTGERTQMNVYQIIDGRRYQLND